MVSYDQAVYFLEAILKMPQNWKDLLQNKPLEFLSVYIKRHAIRVPFQNLHMAATPETNRWFPSLEQIIENGLSGRGGCCLHLNYFTKLVFQAIGLDSFSVRGDHYCALVAGTHCMTMVRLHGRQPEETGIWMIEVGGAFPMIEPIPMDSHRLPYKTLQAAGFPYEFREIGKGWIGKFHIGGGTMGGAYTDKKEILRTSWDLKPRELWEFDYPMLEIFTKPCYSALLRGPYMYRFFSNTEFKKLFPELAENSSAGVKDTCMFKGGKKVGGLIRIKNSKPVENVPKKKPDFLGTVNKENDDSEVVTMADEELMESVEDDDAEDLNDPKNFIFAYKLRVVVADAKLRKIVRDYESYEEMGEDLKKYFPKIPIKVMDNAIKTFIQYKPQPSADDKIL